MPPITLSTSLDRISFELVHSWLTTTYWSPGITREIVEKAARGSSLVIGAFDGERQVGYLRVVSDKATFAWIADVYVDPAYRGQGIAKQMVKYAMADTDHREMRRWVLASLDAHSVYAACGFAPLKNPERWMVAGQRIAEQNAKE